MRYSQADILDGATGHRKEYPARSGKRRIRLYLKVNDIVTRQASLAVKVRESGASHLRSD